MNLACGHGAVVRSPKTLSPTPSFIQVSCGSCVMGSLRVVGSLSEALADTVGSVGFTRRAGGARVTHASLRRLLAEYPEVLPERSHEPGSGAERRGPTAMVFGYVLPFSLLCPCRTTHNSSSRFEELWNYLLCSHKCKFECVWCISYICGT